MPKIILAMFATLDGFVETPDGKMIAPAWSDDLERFWSEANTTGDITLLYGRRAFEQNAALWPAVEQDENNGSAFRTMAARMNRLPKVVISNSLRTAGWNSSIARGRLSNTIGELKGVSRDVIAVGGVTLAANLLAEDLVDEYRLLMMPTFHGGGHSLFKTPHAPISLNLKSHRAMDSGAVLLEYTRSRGI
jgi:dihydrofolate reductase